MSLTPRRLNRATLARQLLLERERLDVAEAVRRVTALQAQEPASPYLALWNRVAALDAADVDAAFARRVVVKASLIRLTLHAVHHGDYASFHRAMESSLRASRLHDRRFTSSGLSIADADALVLELLAFASTPRTSSEIDAMLADRLGRRVERLWWALRMFAPLHHEPTGGPWSFGPASSFVVAPRQTLRPSQAAGVQSLLLRYLEAFGPATAADFAQFTMLRRPAVVAAVSALGDRVRHVGGTRASALLDVDGAPLPPEDAASPPRLLPMWDSVLLAYADRSRVIAAEHRPLVIRRNGDVLASVLVDGRVVGVWRPSGRGIEVTAFEPITAEAWSGLESEAAALVAFLADREPDVYGRYGHWWAKGMPGEVRVLAGG